MKALEVAYQRVEVETAELMRDLIISHGVPTNSTQAHALAQELYLPIMESRNRMWMREAEAIAKEFPDVEIGDIAPYNMQSTQKLVMNCAGLNKEARSTVLLEYYDPETQKMRKTRMTPYLDPDDPTIIAAFEKRVHAATARHIKQASRDLIEETAYKNGMGWARQLTGKENCTMCALLASRGAVYREDTVLTKRDGSRYHDNCDCTATLVKGGRYEGDDEAQELYGLWLKAGGDMSEFGKLYREAMSFVGVAA
ncbi:hypothetical protein CDES_14075 [Corynebacterium deserti GIMN1.010]|uniref:Phage head morphogenesis domain-containing protein n=1 Tax=Corynebacterium deserti GIMN1.010 TaxID=931089 RepID=A0A0M4CIF2_9CORY|nr:hypothetical protein [Corynebacterium deserti]ALC07140.1 hypothetical protein CDES_14075 [Corynebacterium deserti GIMN1.010]